MTKLRTMRKPARTDPGTTIKPQPISLAPLSFEDAVRALAATPPMTDKPKRQPATRRKKRSRQKAS
jgi:hypothetical protein